MSPSVRGPAALPPCSDASRARGDDMGASAGVSRRWFLVEDPRPWAGRDALASSHLERAAARAVQAAVKRHGARVLMVRRFGRTPPGTVRRWGWADSRPGRESLRWGFYEDDAELVHAATDPDGTGAAGAGGSAPDDGPAFLVCTHGRHDRCCAVRGRRTAQALAEAHPARTWECSHLGGDRFAPNLLVLPHAFLFGRADPAAALDVVASYGAGRLDLAHLRGRCGLTGAEQAAQQVARRTFGRYGLDDLCPLGTYPLPDHGVRVRLADGRARVLVDLHEEVVPFSSPLTCGGEVAGHLARWHVHAVERLPGPGAGAPGPGEGQDPGGQAAGSPPPSSRA